MNNLHIVAAALAGLTIAACATSPTKTANPPSAAKPAIGPITLRMPIEGVMISTIDFSSYGVFKAATAEQPLTQDDWGAAGVAALSLIGSSSLITLPGTGENDAAWVVDERWRASAMAMQAASVQVGIAVRKQDRVGLLLAADQLAEACEACHKVFRPDLPKVEANRYASLR